MLDRRFLEGVNLVVQGVANEPKANPTTGIQYIVGSSPAGDFADAETGSIARYDGEAWIFDAPKAGGLEVFNVDTGKIMIYDGSEWAVSMSIEGTMASPVLAIVKTGATLPVTAAIGDKFLKTDDAKIYTATAANTWDSGVLTSDGDRYASSTDFKIYESNGTELTGKNIPSGGTFLNKDDGYIYFYDNTFSRVSADEVVTETHVLTANNISDEGFALNNSVVSGYEDGVMLFLSGVAQRAGVDFIVSGNTISWENKTLASFGLRVGDVMIVQYTKAHA